MVSILWNPAVEFLTWIPSRVFYFAVSEHVLVEQKNKAPVSIFKANSRLLFGEND